MQATRRSINRESKDHLIHPTILPFSPGFFFSRALALSGNIQILLNTSLTLNCHLHLWRETWQDSLIRNFSNEQPSDFLLRIATPSLQIWIMSRHILKPALPEHLDRGRSSRHPGLASRLVRNGITVVRKKCSEASLLKVWVDHCSLPIYPNIIIRDQFYVETGEKCFLR